MHSTPNSLLTTEHLIHWLQAFRDLFFTSTGNTPSGFPTVYVGGVFGAYAHVVLVHMYQSVRRFGCTPHQGRI